MRKQAKWATGRFRIRQWSPACTSLRVLVKWNKTKTVPDMSFCITVIICGVRRAWILGVAGLSHGIGCGGAFTLIQTTLGLMVSRRKRAVAGLRMPDVPLNPIIGPRPSLPKRSVPNHRPATRIIPDRQESDQPVDTCLTEPGRPSCLVLSIQFVLHRTEHPPQHFHFLGIHLHPVEQTGHLAIEP